jgi:hypothetical protein
MKQKDHSMPIPDSSEDTQSEARRLEDTDCMTETLPQFCHQCCTPKERIGLCAYQPGEYTCPRCGKTIKVTYLP